MGKENRLKHSTQFALSPVPWLKCAAFPFHDDQQARARTVARAWQRKPTFRAFLVMLLLSAWAWPAIATKSAPSPISASTDVAEKQSDLKDLREQIEALRKNMADAESTRADAADQLKDAEREISLTQRELYNLSKNRSELHSTIKNLGTQSRELASRLQGQQTQLEKLIHRQYLQGNPDSLRLILSGNDPNQLARDLHYLAAIGRARSHLLREIESTLQRKQALAANTSARAEQLASIESTQKEQHNKLLAQREQRKATLLKISAKISAQRREIGSLERDEKRLSQLITRVAKIIAEKTPPRQEVLRKEKERVTRVERVDPVELAPGNKRVPDEVATTHVPEAIPSGNFIQLKGKLRLPAKGKVSNRFGSARQEGSTWKGLFIRAVTGGEVKAIAGGRVVFAEWMRGFGNLLIVDHGSGYLSIYGNNDSLLKQVGEPVHGGDSIASVGNSGGNPESGLYFELRHQGQPLDPLKWVNIR